MIPLSNYPHIPHWTTIREAVAIFRTSQIEVNGIISLPRVLLVFHKDYSLLGLVRRRDIFRGLEPKFLRTMPHTHRRELFDMEVDINLIDLSTGKIADAMCELADQQVADIMQPIHSSVAPDDHLAKVIYKMINRDITLVPVIDNGRVVGVIRSVDALEEIGRILEEKAQQP